MSERSSSSSEPSERRPARPRLAVIDAARGVAVVAMIEWHVADAWIGGEARASGIFGWMKLIGGFAAPAFVLLAGLAIALSSPARPTASDTIANVRRGARIALAGYALSLFAWAIDHGGIAHGVDVIAIALAALGLGCLAFATDEPRGRGVRRAAMGIAGLLVMLGAVAVPSARTALLMRLDVLHGIGAAVIVTALALHLTRSMSVLARASLLALASITVATVSVRMSGVPQSFAPTSVARWIARGEGSAFPLFPWLAYALLGASIAIAVRSRPFELASRWALPHVTRPWMLIPVAALVVALTWELGPTARLVLEREEALRSLLRLAFNTSVIVGTSAALAMLGSRGPERFAGPAITRLLDVLALLGRRSLVVYCVHLELVYGVAAASLHRALGAGGWAIAVVVITLAMVALARSIERASRPRERSATAVHAMA